MLRLEIGLVILLFMTALLSHCSYDHTLPDCVANQKVDISFKSDVMPILVNQCLQCHDLKNRIGGVVLDTCPKVKLYSDAGELYSTVSYAPGYLPMMPKGGILSDCDILIINEWAEEGSPCN